MTGRVEVRTFSRSPAAVAPGAAAHRFLGSLPDDGPAGLLDVGITDARYAGLIPAHDFTAPLSLLTQELGRRHATAYQDMDFYADIGESAYRPWTTVNELRGAGVRIPPGTPHGSVRRPRRRRGGDVSWFRYLRAQGLTLMLMANAHRVAEAMGRA